MKSGQWEVKQLDNQILIRKKSGNNHEYTRKEIFSDDSVAFEIVCNHNRKIIAYNLTYKQPKKTSMFGNSVHVINTDVYSDPEIEVIYEDHIVRFVEFMLGEANNYMIVGRWKD